MKRISISNLTKWIHIFLGVKTRIIKRLWARVTVDNNPVRTHIFLEVNCGALEEDAHELVGVPRDGLGAFDPGHLVARVLAQQHPASPRRLPWERRGLAPSNIWLRGVSYPSQRRRVLVANLAGGGGEITLENGSKEIESTLIILKGWF